jgi:hypothetical protein
MTNAVCSNGDAPGGLASPTRNRYFYGKLLDAYHFQLEQKYFNRKRWLLNHLDLGWGVICGLSVTVSNDGSHLVVGPGVALDGWGREIIVPLPSPALDPRQPTDDCGQPSGNPIAGTGVVSLWLGYHECPAEPVPVLVGDCDTDLGCAPSTIRERYKILVRVEPAPAISWTCQFPNLFTPGGLQTIQQTLANHVSQACPDPPQDPCIPLAQINLPAAGQAIDASMIDPTIRSVVLNNDLLFDLLLCLAEQGGGGPPPPPQFTTVTAISWTHDGSMSFNDFMIQGVTVTFSDPIASVAGHVRGWFKVTVEYPVGLTQGNPAGSPIDAVAPPGTILVQHVLEERAEVSGNHAIFIPHQLFRNTHLEFMKLTEVIRAPQPNRAICRVVLECDFLTGAGGHIVDGNFLGASLPFGDGVAGGRFESWFALNPD